MVLYLQRKGVISHVKDNVSPECNKIISSILNMGQPTNITELHSFLGFINQAQTWYPDIAQSTLKLRELLKKYNQFSGAGEHTEEFEIIKKI